MGKRKGASPGGGTEGIKFEINVNDLTAREGEREAGESRRGRQEGGLRTRDQREE